MTPAADDTGPPQLSQVPFVCVHKAQNKGCWQAEVKGMRRACCPAICGRAGWRLTTESESSPVGHVAPPQPIPATVSLDALLPSWSARGERGRSSVPGGTQRVWYNVNTSVSVERTSCWPLWLSAAKGKRRTDVGACCVTAATPLSTLMDISK